MRKYYYFISLRRRRLRHRHPGRGICSFEDFRGIYDAHFVRYIVRRYNPLPAFLPPPPVAALDKRSRLNTFGWVIARVVIAVVVVVVVVAEPCSPAPSSARSL